MSLLLPFRGFAGSQGGIVLPPDPPDPGEMEQPPFAAATLLAQDDFTSAGGYNLNNFSGPGTNSGANPNEVWPMATTAPPPKGAFYGIKSNRISVNPAGWLEGYFDESPTPITVNYQGTNYQVYRHGHYFAWNGQGGAARMRSGVLVFKQQYPPKFAGMGHVNLPWPTDERWPQHGEHDITENFSPSSGWNSGLSSPNNLGFEVNIHYGDGTAENRVLNRRVGGVDMTQPHIIGFAYHAGDDEAGTNCYLAGFVNIGSGWVYKWGVKYNDLISYTIQSGPNAGTTRTNRPGTEIIPHGVNAVTMNLRQQTEAYGSTDATYIGGRQAFRFYYYQAWSPLTLAQMQAQGYLL